MNDYKRMLSTVGRWAVLPAMVAAMALVAIVPPAAAISVVATQDYTIGPGPVLHATAVAQPDIAGATANYTLGFTTPSALVGGSSTLTLAAPTGSVKFPSAKNAYVVIDNTSASGDQTASSTSLGQGANTVTLALPVSIAAGSSLSIYVIGATNPAHAGYYSIDISTSANPEAAATADFQIIAAASKPTFAPVATPAIVGGLSTYTIGTFSAASSLTPGSHISLSSYGLAGAVDNIGFPTNAASYKVEDLTTSTSSTPQSVSVSAVGSGVTGETVDLQVAAPVAAGDELSVTIEGARNPTTTQVDTLTAAAPSNSAAEKASLQIGTSVTNPSISLSSSGAGAKGAGYTVGFKATTAIPAKGTVTLVAPPGTSFSGATVTAVDTTHLAASANVPTSSLNVSASSSSSTGNILEFALPHSIDAGDNVLLEIDGVTNPSAGSYGGSAGNFTVATSTDVLPVNVPAYTISAGHAPVLASIEVRSTTPGAVTEYTLSDLRAVAALASGAQVGIRAPAGTLLPASISSYTIEDVSTASGSAHPSAVSGGGTNEVTLTLSAAVAQGNFIEILINGVTNPPPGVYHIDVVGNLTAAAVTSPPVPPPVGPNTTATALSASANPVQLGMAVTYTATVSPTPNGGVVVFTDNGAPIRGCTSQPLSGSKATCQTTYWRAGLQSVQAIYVGNSGFKRSTSSVLSQTVSLPPTGYWLLAKTGAVFGLGGAPSLGNAALSSSSGSVVGIAGTPSGRGYWVVTSNGTVSAFGDAKYYGDLPALGVRARDVIAIAPTYDGHGYWLIGRDGGMFTFGNAKFHGSVPGLRLHVHDVVGMVASSGGGGYLLVGADGGVFTFGSAHFYGSLPGIHRHVHDIRAILPSSSGRGYVLVGADGGAFIFGSGVHFLGSLPGEGVHVRDIVGIALTPDDGGYFMAGANGMVYGFGDAHPYPTPAALAANLPVVQIAGT